MRPITLVLQVAVAATSAAIGRAFTPPRHLARLQHATSWRRLSTASATNSRRTATARTASVEGRHRQPRLRPSLQAFGFPRSDTRGGGRRQALLAASSSSQSRRGLYCLPGDHDGGPPSQAAGPAYSTGVSHSYSTGVSHSSSSSSSNSVDQQQSGSDVDDVLTQESDDLGAGLHPAAAEDEELNESQRNAVFAEVGAVRVVAGPGSGKTRVLTRRIAHLVRAETAIMSCTYQQRNLGINLGFRMCHGCIVSRDQCAGSCSRKIVRHNSSSVVGAL